MISTLLAISGFAVVEQLFATMDLISTVQRKLLLNWVVVFFSIIVDGYVIVTIAENPNFLIILTYALVSATASIGVIWGEHKLRMKRILNKKLKSLEKARAVKKLMIESEDYYDNGIIDSGNEGECK